MNKFNGASREVGKRYLISENSRRLQAQDRANPLAARKYRISHRGVNGFRLQTLRRHQLLEMRVYGKAVFFEKVGKFHRLSD